ncbi:MAG: hypothetical protein ACLFU8_16020 [Anaerolineales bacterium]
MESSEDNAEWQIWHQDTFDRESPRRMELQGRGLVKGLAELWLRHLTETVRAGGGSSFSRFNLWWQPRGLSVRVVGTEQGLLRLRGWIVERGGRRIDRQLLNGVARAHARMVRAGGTSAPLVDAALTSRDAADFKTRLHKF